MRTVLAIASLFVASPVAAQRVLVVERGVSGRYQTIPAAIQAARPGDVIDIKSSRAGSYEHFDLLKGVTIRGNGNQVRYVSRSFVTNIGVPVGQRAHIEGLRFSTGRTRSGVSVGRVNVAGNVSLVGCTFDCQSQWPQALRVGWGHLTLRSCTIRAGAGSFGLRTAYCDVSATDTFIYGGGQGCLGRNCRGGPSSAGAAIEIWGGTLHADRLVAQGGSVQHPFVKAGAGLRIGAFARVWLVGSRLTGGNHPTLGANALANLSTIPAELHRTTLQPGTAAKPSVGPVRTNTALVSVRAHTAFALGKQLTLDYTLPASTPIVVLLSAGIAPAVKTPVTAQPVALLGRPTVLVAAGASSAAGAYRMTLPVPNLPPLRLNPIWFHGFAGAKTPLQTAVPWGGLAQ